MGKMKWLNLAFWTLVLCSPCVSADSTDSPLTNAEQALTFSPSFLKTGADGHGYLVVRGEPLSVSRLLSLSPWDLMDLVQTLSGMPWPLSRFGTGNGDPLTKAWRTKVASFAVLGDASKPPAQEDLFDPALVLWDPGYIQNVNEWGQWYLRLDHRDIVQDDLPTLSPLEVQQAVTVLTGRTYPIEFILNHLEAFRTQLSVVPRLTEASVHP